MKMFSLLVIITLVIVEVKCYQRFLNVQSKSLVRPKVQSILSVNSAKVDEGNLGSNMDRMQTVKFIDLFVLKAVHANTLANLRKVNKIQAHWYEKFVEESYPTLIKNDYNTRVNLNSDILFNHLLSMKNEKVFLYKKAESSADFTFNMTFVVRPTDIAKVHLEYRVPALKELLSTIPILLRENEEVVKFAEMYCTQGDEIAKRNRQSIFELQQQTDYLQVVSKSSTGTNVANTKTTPSVDAYNMMDLLSTNLALTELKSALRQSHNDTAVDYLDDFVDNISNSKVLLQLLRKRNLKKNSRSGSTNTSNRDNDIKDSNNNSGDNTATDESDVDDIDDSNLPFNLVLTAGTNSRRMSAGIGPGNYLNRRDSNNRYSNSNNNAVPSAGSNDLNGNGNTASTIIGTSVDEYYQPGSPRHLLEQLFTRGLQGLVQPYDETHPLFKKRGSALYSNKHLTQAQRMELVSNMVEKETNLRSKKSNNIYSKQPPPKYNSSTSSSGNSDGDDLQELYNYNEDEYDQIERNIVNVGGASKPVTEDDLLLNSALVPPAVDVLALAEHLVAQREKIAVSLNGTLSAMMFEFESMLKPALLSAVNKKILSDPDNIVRDLQTGLSAELLELQLLQMRRLNTAVQSPSFAMNITDDVYCYLESSFRNKFKKLADITASSNDSDGGSINGSGDGVDQEKIFVYNPNDADDNESNYNQNNNNHDEDNDELNQPTSRYRNPVSSDGVSVDGDWSGPITDFEQGRKGWKVTVDSDQVQVGVAGKKQRIGVAVLDPPGSGEKPPRTPDERDNDNTSDEDENSRNPVNYGDIDHGSIDTFNNLPPNSVVRVIGMKEDDENPAVRYICLEAKFKVVVGDGAVEQSYRRWVLYEEGIAFIQNVNTPLASATKSAANNDKTSASADDDMNNNPFLGGNIPLM